MTFVVTIENLPRKIFLSSFLKSFILMRKIYCITFVNLACVYCNYIGRFQINFPRYNKHLKITKCSQGPNCNEVYIDGVETKGNFFDETFLMESSNGLVLKKYSDSETNLKRNVSILRLIFKHCGMVFMQTLQFDILIFF